MRQKIIISIAILFFVISFYKVTTPGLTGIKLNAGHSVSDSFIVGATDNAWQRNNDTLVNRLGYNVWHKYAHEGNGWRHVGAEGDFLFADSAEYYQQVKSVIIDNASDNILTTMDRGKISLLAWSQRSDYQCEQTLDDNDYWFYGFNTHGTDNMADFVDDGIHGDGERVRHCWPNSQSTDGGQGWVVKNLKANREQVNNGTNWPWPEMNDSCEWIIKPRIRIDSAYANNPLNAGKEVCRIDVLNFNGDTIKSVNIKVINFIEDSTYNGDYIDEYFNLHQDSILEITDGILFNPDKKHFTDSSCKVDFRVWYYGNCEMWIDRIRVDNEVAHRLLSGEDEEYEDWLRWESNLAMENPDNIWNFYIEEFEFNNTPSIAYVNNKIKYYTNDTFSLMVNFNYELYKAHLPDHESQNISAVKINKYLFDSTGIRTWWNISYPFEGYKIGDVLGDNRLSFHPTTLSSSNYNKNSGILSYPTSVNSYEDTLQWKLDFAHSAGGGYTKVMKISDELNKMNGFPVINLMQVHLWHDTGHKLKEPSKEELKLLSMLPLTYGAKGIMYFTYASNGLLTEPFYYRGIIEPGISPIIPRETNVYGQPKWENLKEISSHLSKIGPYLMSFDDENRKSFFTVCRMKETKCPQVLSLMN